MRWGVLWLVLFREKIPCQTAERASADTSSLMLYIPSVGSLNADMTPTPGADDETESRRDVDPYPERRYYILSSAGKPVYISHLSTARSRRRSSTSQSAAQAGDYAETAAANDAAACADEENRRAKQAAEDEADEMATTQVGVMQALISIFADENSDKLRHINAGGTRISFLLRAPLYLVCVSAWGEPPSAIRSHLEYLHLQVLSIVSAGQLTRLFSRAPNFDLRRLMEGTDGLLAALLGRLQTDLALPLAALQPVRLAPAIRDSLALALQPGRSSSGSQSGAASTSVKNRPRELLYVVLLAGGRIVTLIRPRKHSVHPADMHLLINIVHANAALREAGSESWVPICLPKFAPQGFVHAYVSFLGNTAEEGKNKDSQRREGNKKARDNAPTKDSASKAQTDKAKGPEEQTKRKDAGPRRGRMAEDEMALIFVTGNREGFFELSEWRHEVIKVSRNSRVQSHSCAA